MAGGLGLEPRLTGPKPGVLPLDDPPIHGNHSNFKLIFQLLQTTT